MTTTVKTVFNAKGKVSKVRDFDKAWISYESDEIQEILRGETYTCKVSEYHDKGKLQSLRLRVPANIMLISYDIKDIEDILNLKFSAVSTEIYDETEPHLIIVFR